MGELDAIPSSGGAIPPPPDPAAADAFQPPRVLSGKALQMMGKTTAEEIVSLKTDKPIPIELSTSEKFKQGVIKTAAFALKAFATIIALGVVGPIMLVGTIITGGWLWNTAMSKA